MISIMAFTPLFVERLKQRKSTFLTT